MRIRAALADKEEASIASPLSSSLALSVFHEVFLALSQETDLTSLLSLIAQKARLLTDAASAAILLPTEKPEELTFAAIAGEGSEEMQGTRVHQRDTVAGNTARTGQPYIAYHPVTNNSNLSSPNAATRSAAVVAIFENGKTVGALAVLNKCDDQPFNGEDLLGLSTLAAATSTALATAHLRGDTEQRQKELTVLYESVCQVAMPLSAQEVLEALVAQVRQYFSATVIVTFLFNDEQTHLYIAAEEGLPLHLREVTLSAESGLTPLLLTRNHPVFLTLSEPEERDSLEPLEGTLPVENPFPDLPLRVGIAAPIRSGDVIHGLALVASTRTSGGYTEADAQLLTALSLQAAIAVENAILYEDAAHHAEEATALYDLSVSLNQCQSQEEIIDLVADATTELLTVESFALFLLDGTTEYLNLVGERGLTEGAAGRLRPRLGEGIVGWVAEFETPTAVQDVSADHRNASYPLHAEGVVSLVGMPLQVGAATIGVLCALHTRRRLFTILEVELLYTIANQTAVALDNARLGRDRNRLARDNRFLRRLLEANLGENPETDAEKVTRIHRALTEEYGGEFAILTVSPNGKYDGGWQRMIGYDDAFLRRQLPVIEDGYITSVVVGDLVMRQSFSQNRENSITRSCKRVDFSLDIPDSILVLAARLLR